MNRPSLTFQAVTFSLIRLVFNTMLRMVYPFLSTFKAGLGVDLPAMSLALTIRSLSGVLAPFLASVADSRGRKTGMLLGASIFTFGVTLVIFRPTFFVFALTLVLTTVGYRLYLPSMQAYLGDRVPYERRGRMMAITELSWSLSFILGAPLVALLISRRGWIAPFPLLAIFSALSLGLLSWILPGDTPSKEEKTNVWDNIWKVLTSPLALAGLATGALLSCANESVNLVFGVWMENSFGLKITSLGLTSLAIGLAEFGGESLAGVFTDRIGKVRAVAIGLLINCLAALALPTLGQGVSSAVFSLLLFYSTFEFTVVSVIPLMSEILPSARATLLATNIACVSLGRALGAALASPLYTGSAIPAIAPGIASNAIVVVLFNLLALLSLTRLRASLS